MEAPKARHYRLAMRQAKAMKTRKQKKRAAITLCGHWRNFLRAER